MSGYNIDIADMQCSVFRMAQSKWKMSPSDCALFDFDTEIWEEGSYLLSLYLLHFQKALRQRIVATLQDASFCLIQLSFFPTAFPGLCRHIQNP